MSFIVLRDPETNEEIGYVKPGAVNGRLFASLTDEEIEIGEVRPGPAPTPPKVTVRPLGEMPKLHRTATLYSSSGIAFAIQGEGIHIPREYTIDLRNDNAEEVEIVPAERKQAACIIVEHHDVFIAVVCAKGRGVILPGGHMERGESLEDAARRELKEETGLTAGKLVPLFSSPVGPHDVTAFLCLDYVGRPRSSPEGQVIYAGRETLLQSQFAVFYSRVFKAYDDYTTR